MIGAKSEIFDVRKSTGQTNGYFVNPNRLKYFTSQDFSVETKQKQADESFLFLLVQDFQS